MAIPKNKSELLAAIDKNYTALMQTLAALNAKQAFQLTMPGHMAGTTMTVTNLVAYLIGWNALVLKWLEHDEHQQAIDFPESGYKWNQLGELAQKFYADYAHLNWKELLALLADHQQRILAHIEKRSNAQLYEQPWYGKWTMGRMIQLNTSSPYDNARKRLRRALKTSTANA